MLYNYLIVSTNLKLASLRCYTITRIDTLQKESLQWNKNLFLISISKITKQVIVRDVEDNQILLKIKVCFSRLSLNRIWLF